MKKIIIFKKICFLIFTIIPLFCVAGTNEKRDAIKEKKSMTKEKRNITKANEMVINCTITNNWGVGGWQISLNSELKTVIVRNIGEPNSWTSLTSNLLDQNLKLYEDEMQEGSFYRFGIQEQSGYEVFVINRQTMQIRFASSQTGSTDWGYCKSAPSNLK